MLKKPPQQTFCNPNLLNMRKFCQSLSQPGSDILINSLYPHQSLQGRKDNPADDYILRKLIYLADGSSKSQQDSACRERPPLPAPQTDMLSKVLGAKAYRRR